MGEQRLLQQVAADPGAAALITDLKAPAADGARRAALARHIGGAGAEDSHGAVTRADCPFERDLGVRLDAADAERQDCVKLLAVGADIGSGEAENGWCLRDQVRILPGGDEGLTSSLDDVGASAG